MCEKANQTNGVFFTEKEIPPGEKPDAVIAFFSGVTKNCVIEPLTIKKKYYIETLALVSTSKKLHTFFTGTLFNWGNHK